MPKNPISFAIVREDPHLELELVRERGARRVLVIGSGGCSALTLKACQPSLAITLLDPNPAQLDLARRKIAALDAVRGLGVPRDHGALRLAFGIGADDAHALTACGSFESLFRTLRTFLGEFVCPREAWRSAFQDRVALARLCATSFADPYWPVAFELCFAEALLVSMFGPDAVQHAPKGSYPRYFRQVFERGLVRRDAFDNPWLHHALLGHYLDRDAALPEYLTRPVPPLDLELRGERVQDVADWGEFDLVSLSNVFDWMAREAIAETVHRLATSMKTDAVLLVRQLNHQRPLDEWFAHGFTLDRGRAEEWLARDRSLFYSHVTIATRRRT